MAFAPEACPSEPAPQTPAAGSEQGENSSFADLLEEAGAQPAKPTVPGGLQKTPLKALLPEELQKAQSDAVMMLFFLLPRCTPAAETPLPFNLEISLSGTDGDTEAAAVTAAPAQAPEAPAPAVSLEAPVAFTADIPMDAPEAPAEAPAPVSEKQATPVRVKAAPAEEAVKAPSETPLPVQAVARVEQPAPPSNTEVKAPADPAPVAHEALRESHSLVDTAGPAVPAAQKVQEISIRVQGQDQHNAEVRVQNRGGELHVAVRTPDARLTESLRSDLGELVSKLERSGMDARVWHPAMTPAASETAQTSHQPFEGGREQSRGNQPQRQPRDRRRRNGQQQDFNKQIEAIA
ncbi:MAG: hypothetical protein NTY38_18375 [Acidobacteria bacterium]|nr:hypothetical protein [Acidobacteriota bacterium]